MRKSLCGWAYAAFLVGAAPAQAGVLVDFSDDALWAGAHGNASFYVDYGSLRVHLDATGGDLSVTSFDGVAAALPCTPGPLACDNDGIGINTGDDEVTFEVETLTASFTDLANNPVAVSLETIHFFDLFHFLEGADPLPETAQWAYDIGGGGMLTGTAIGAGTGWASTGVGIPGVHSVTFFATGPLSSANTDFALAALEVDVAPVPVPEPTTVGLLGAGLVALGLRAGRRRLARGKK